MRKFLTCLIILAIGIALVPIQTKADGGIFPPSKYYIEEKGQEAVIFYENGKETLILTVSFMGDAEDFGWVIPVPQKPEISRGSEEIFTSLQEITQQYGGRGYLERIMTMGSFEGGGSPVTVIETKNIDYYEVSVLSATDSLALANWLSDNGYQYPEESAYIFNDYINNQWYFVAAKISSEAAGSEEVVMGLREGHVTPLKLEFNSEAIIYPLRISSIQVGQELIKITENLVLNRQRIEYLKDIGYEDLTDKEKGPEIFKQIVSDLFAQKDYSESVASEYPLIVSESNYYQTTCTSLRNCQNLSEGWFNSFFSREGLYFSVYDYNRVPIYLYVIADGKKEIPGFSINYANWIKSKEIRELAYDTNGKPLLNAQGKRYYLSYLYRNISINEMTNDLVIREAENNRRVNAPNPWLDFLLEGLIALGCIFIWILSPLGIIFIAGTLINVFVKSKAVAVLGRIFQILSLIITFCFFAFFLIVVLKIIFIPATSLWMVGLTSGLGLTLIGQIIVIFLTKKLKK